MKPQKITWIGFLVTLSALTIPTKTIAEENTSFTESEPPVIENRLNKIAKTLKERENARFFQESSNPEDILESPENRDLAGWLKGYRGGFLNNRGGGGFLNNRGGGGFLNRRGWRDGGGFLNRRWPNGGGFFNRRY